DQPAAQQRVGPQRREQLGIGDPGQREQGQVGVGGAAEGGDARGRAVGGRGGGGTAAHAAAPAARPSPRVKPTTRQERRTSSANRFANGRQTSSRSAWSVSRSHRASAASTSHPSATSRSRS